MIIGNCRRVGSILNKNCPNCYDKRLLSSADVKAKIDDRCPYCGEPELNEHLLKLEKINREMEKGIIP